MFSKFPPISWPEVNIRNQVFWTLGVLSKKKSIDDHGSQLSLLHYLWHTMISWGEGRWELFHCLSNILNSQLSFFPGWFHSKLKTSFYEVQKLSALSPGFRVPHCFPHTRAFSWHGCGHIIEVSAWLQQLQCKHGRSANNTVTAAGKMTQSSSNFDNLTTIVTAISTHERKALWQA